MSFKVNKWQNKKIGVLGFGISGREACLFLLKNDAKVTLYDEADEEKLNQEYLKVCKKFKNFNLMVGQGAFGKINQHDFLVLSSGIKLNRPEFEGENFLSAEKINEEMIFMDACPNNYQIVGVTGSNGKSTIVSLLYETLKFFEKNPVLCGNIGFSPLAVFKEPIDLEEKRTFAFELSSASLAIFKSEFTLPILAITNISPNHLDWHGTMDNYAESKLKGYSEKTKLIINLDDEGTRQYILPKIKNHKKVFGVSLTTMLDEATMPGIYLTPENYLAFFDGEENFLLYDLSSERKILGSHNVYNIAFVLLILCLLGYEADKVENIINHFKGLEHRIEFVRQKDGIKFINDSKSTTPDALAKALETIGESKNICLIAGGDDKKVSYNHLLPLFIENIKHLSILKGSIDEKLIVLAEKAEIPFSIHESMAEAIKESEKNAKSGDIVLLSPGSSSHNMFNNFEHRGWVFKEIVLA